MIAMFRMGLLTGEEFLFFRFAERRFSWLDIAGRTTG
jgi:hypothetical protein